jgi:hypothetical protein
MKRLTTAVLFLALAVPAFANHSNSDPNAVYGTITGWDPNTKLLTLLDGAIVVDVSRAHIVDKQTGFPGTPIAVGLQAKIILRPGPYTMPLAAALVELQTRTAASMAGSVTSIDLGASTFVAAGIAIHVDQNTKWRGGADVRELSQLQRGQTITADLRRDGDTIVATEIFVVGVIPPSNHYTFGKVLAIEGDTWIIRDTTGRTWMFKTFERTIFNSQVGGMEVEARVGEYVNVTSYPNDEGVEIAYVITVVAPPIAGTDFGMYGTLVEVNEEEKFLAIAVGGEGEREEFAITEDTGFYLGAKVGDYVEVRAQNRRVNGRPVAFQVIKAQRIRRVGFQGTVKAIEGNRWTIDGWTVIVTPQTLLINNPKVGDVVKVLGEGEHGSQVLQGISIERI